MAEASQSNGDDGRSYGSGTNGNGGVKSGSGSGGGDGGGNIYFHADFDWRPRMHTVEAGLTAVEGKFSGLHDDFRKAIGFGIAAVVGLAGMIAVGYLMLNGEIKSTRQELTDTIRFEISRLSEDIKR